MALHLEGDDHAIADIDDAGILPRTVDDAGPFGRQGLEMDLRRFVRAMLVPHRRNDAEFGEAWLAAHQAEEPIIFVRLQPCALTRSAVMGGSLLFALMRGSLIELCLHWKGAERHAAPATRRTRLAPAAEGAATRRFPAWLWRGWAGPHRYREAMAALAPRRGLCIAPCARALRHEPDGPAMVSPDIQG